MRNRNVLKCNKCGAEVFTEARERACYKCGNQMTFVMKEGEENEGGEK